MPIAPAFWHYYRELAKYILLSFLLLLLSYAFWAPIGPCSEHSSCLEGNLRVENPPTSDALTQELSKAFYIPEICSELALDGEEAIQGLGDTGFMIIEKK